MENLFVPKDFIIPLSINNTDFILRKLTTSDVEKDFEAVMSSKKNLRNIFCENDEWPADNMTLQDNYNDLKEHEEEFNQRKGFTYTVVKPDEEMCLGCVYIYPWFGMTYDCQVYFWVRDSEIKNGLERKLESFIRQWLQDKWSLNNPVFPGRDLSWNEWKDFIKTSRAQTTD